MCGIGFEEFLSQSRSELKVMSEKFRTNVISFVIDVVDASDV
jgi:hypothetical protein